MVKTTKLSEEALRNPFSAFSRIELDTALREIDMQLASMPPAMSSKRMQVELRRRQIVEGYLWLLVREGRASWSGSKPKGSTPPVEITPGPPVSDYIVEDRLR